MNNENAHVPFCCDYHDHYGDHCLFQYQTLRPPKASDAARRILSAAIASGAAVPSWNSGQRQEIEVKILAAIDAALTTARQEERQAVIAIVQSVSNNNDLDDGGFFEAGFIAARTKSIDALIKASATEKGEVNG